MNLNEKTDVNHNIGFYTELKEKTKKTTMKNNTRNQIEFQFKSVIPPKIKTIITNSLKSTRYAFPLRQIVCDVCCAPLYLYSETFISAYLDPRAELPPSLCDNHLFELEQEVCK